MLHLLNIAQKLRAKSQKNRTLITIDCNYICRCRLTGHGDVQSGSHCGSLLSLAIS
jgi:hypothetical protein